jgi:hypothetical protein
MHALVLRIAVLGPVWLYHPLGNCTGTRAEQTRCLSYNFWSGIGSDLAYITTIGGAVFVGWRSYKHWRTLHVCHEEGCKLIGTFHLPSGARACVLHHPHLDTRPVNERGLIQKLQAKHLDDLHAPAHNGPGETSTQAPAGGDAGHAPAGGRTGHAPAD